MRIDKGLFYGFFMEVLVEIANDAQVIYLLPRIGKQTYKGLFWRLPTPKRLFWKWLIRVLARN
jgi:hypothetical protein